MNTPGMIPFPTLANAGPDDIVIFSWIVFKSRQHRDEVNAKVINDPRIETICPPDAGIIDCKKMAYGGFETIIEL